MPYKDPQCEAAKACNRKKSRKWKKFHPEYQKAWQRLHPGYRATERYRRTRRDAHYRRLYGISVEEFEARIEAQGGRCPIGNHPFSRCGNGKFSPCLDHDHRTRKDRGILCREHNKGLGSFHDAVEELQEAIDYVKSYKERGTKCQV